MEVLLTCPLDCPDACRLRVTLEQERAVAITGDAQHPTTQGFACAKTVHYPSRQYHPERPRTPLKKINGVFEPISWTQALDEIASRMRQILDTAGPSAILPYHYGGTMGMAQGSHVHTLFRALGACELDETICATAGSEAWSLGYGSPRYGVDPEDVPHARLIVLWGINSLTTNSHLTPFLKKARQNGAVIYHIDPYANKTSRFADHHLKLKPATDAALAWGIMGYCFAQGAQDQDYLEQHCQDWQALQQEASMWSLERTAELTGLSLAEVTQLAEAYASVQPSFIRVGYGMTRHEFGGSALRAVSLLPAVRGQWRYRGGGATLSTSGAFTFNRKHLGGNHLISQQNPPKVVNMNELGTVLQPDRGIQALFVYNCNPIVVAPDSQAVQAGFARPDLLTVVLENAWTETAQAADYVLPATTFLEHADLYLSYGHYYLSYNPVTLAAWGESKPNTWIFAELGRRLGITEPSLYWDDDTLFHELLSSKHPFLQGITLDLLKAQGYLRLNIPRPFLPYAEGANTANKRIRCAPLPVYRATSDQPDEQYPLCLITPPAHHFLNTTYGLVDRLNRAEGGEPAALMHPKDALAAGVQDGDYAYLSSPQGKIMRLVRVSSAVQAGLVVLEGIWWGDQAPDGQGVNVLTSQRLTDIGRGSTFHQTYIRVWPVDDAVAEL